MGIFAEESVPGGILGELGSKIVGEVFRNLRNGDRFWYEGGFPPVIINEIRDTTFADVIVRNTGINYGEINNNVFRL